MKIELLPFSRWSELKQAFAEARIDGALPKPEQAIMIVASEGERIIGAVGAERAWTVSPIWIDRAFRGNGLAQQLADEIKKYNVEDLAEYLVTTNPHVERLVFSLGFKPLAGQLWRRD